MELLDMKCDLKITQLFSWTVLYISQCVKISLMTFIFSPRKWILNIWSLGPQDDAGSNLRHAARKALHRYLEWKKRSSRFGQASEKPNTRLGHVTFKSYFFNVSFTAEILLKANKESGLEVQKWNYLFLFIYMKSLILHGPSSRESPGFCGNTVSFSTERKCIQKFPDWIDNDITINTRWETTQRVMAEKLARLTYKIAILLHLVTESCTICSSCSKRPVRKFFGYTLVYYKCFVHF
jgi:hypothetical protein